MTSLLGSIFGGEAQKDETRESLFDESKALPERPQHKPVERPPSRDRSGDGDVTFSEEAADGNKRRTKGRKPQKSAGATQNPEDGNDAGGRIDDERTIFVGNLPLISRKALARLFADCGTVHSARLRNIPVTGIKLPPSEAGNQDLMRKVCVNTGKIESTAATVQGYVVFKSAESVEKALQLNNVLKVEGHTLRIDRAKPTIDASRSVFVGNLSHSHTDEASLQKHFETGCSLEKGDIEGVRIVREKETRQCKGFGYILFRDKSLAASALKLHGTTYNKRELRVQVCGKRLKGGKGNRSTAKKSAATGASVPKSPSNGKQRQTKSAGAVHEQATAGAFRRILAKQATQSSKSYSEKDRKRGAKRKSSTNSKRAAIEKKTEKRVKKLQKRMVKGMGKNKNR